MKKFLWPIVGLLWLSAVRAGPPPEIMRQALEEAGLSRQQVAKIEDMVLQAEKEKVEIKYRLDTARLELKKLLSEKLPDKKAVFEKLEQIGRLEVELRKNRLGLMLEIRTLMTPEQWEKVEKFHRNWMKVKFERERERIDEEAP